MLYNNKPISVLMSVYNNQDFVGDAIHSILNQTFTNFEFIIIDDGSNDASSEIIHSFKDKRIIFLKNSKNIGLSASLNRGIKIAKGKYIARMDADDISYPERLEKQYNFMQHNQDIGLLGTGYHQINELGEIIGINKFTNNPVKINWKLLASPVFAHPTVMIRKAVLVNNNLLYDEKYHVTQDYKLWCSLLKFTIGSNLSDALIKYRKHSKSKSNIEFSNQEIFRIKTSIEHIKNNYRIKNLNIDQAKIISKIINIDVKSLTISDLSRVDDIFFNIYKIFYNNISSPRLLVNSWKRFHIFPLIIEFESLLINNTSSKEDMMIYINYLFNLIKYNILLLMKHLFLKPRLIIYYYYWFVRLLIHIVYKNICNYSNKLKS